MDDRKRKKEKVVAIRYRIDGKFKYVKTGIYVNPDEWDVKQHKVCRTTPGYSEANQRIRAFKKLMEAQFLSVEKALTSNIVDQILSGSYIPENQRTRETPFTAYARMVNRMLYENGHFGLTTYKNKECCIRAFEKFESDVLGKAPISLGGLTQDHLQNYYAYRYSGRGNKSIETAGKAMIPLFAAIQYANNHGILSNQEACVLLEYEKNMFCRRNPRYMPEEDGKSVKYLTMEQIRQLEQYSPGNPRTKDFIDIFLFCFYCCGMRISDAMTLEWSNIDQERLQIRKIQVKTRRKSRVPTYMRPEALDILKRWHGRNCRFVFDLLAEEFDLSDEEALYRRRLSVTRTINTSLKRIGEKLGFAVPLTTHKQCHTFVVLAINNDMPIYTLSALMGHASIKTTEKVYAKLLDQKVKADYDECMAKVFVDRLA